MGAAIKAIRTRIHSVKSTAHITHAMQLVASSKMKRAQQRLEDSKYYYEVMERAFAELACGTSDSPYLRQTEGKKTLCIMIAGDRGLAGGYNNNIFKLAQSQPRDTVFIPIGKRAVDYVRSHGLDASEQMFDSAEKLTAAECDGVGKAVSQLFLTGEYSRVVMLYTDYISALTQTARQKTLLPAEPPQHTAAAGGARTKYEPSPEAVLGYVVPLYLSGMIWGGLCESYASEVASRRNAMDSATKNADEMLDSLELQYNRARQSTITQEITEIVAGSAPEQR